MKHKATASSNANRKRAGSMERLNVERERARSMESLNAECKRAGLKAMSNQNQKSNVGSMTSSEMKGKIDVGVTA